MIKTTYVMDNQKFREIIEDCEGFFQNGFKFAREQFESGTDPIDPPRIVWVDDQTNFPDGVILVISDERLTLGQLWTSVDDMLKECGLRES